MIGGKDCLIDYPDTGSLPMEPVLSFFRDHWQNAIIEECSEKDDPPEKRREFFVYKDQSYKTGIEKKGVTKKLGIGFIYCIFTRTQLTVVVDEWERQADIEKAVRALFK